MLYDRSGRPRPRLHFLRHRRYPHQITILRQHPIEPEYVLPRPTSLLYPHLLAIRNQPIPLLHVLYIQFVGDCGLWRHHP